MCIVCVLCYRGPQNGCLCVMGGVGVGVGGWVHACMCMCMRVCDVSKSIWQHRVVKPHPNACTHSKRNKTPRGQPLEGLRSRSQHRQTQVTGSTHISLCIEEFAIN